MRRLLIGLVGFGLVAILAVDSGGGRITDNAARAVTVATLPCGTSLQATSSGFVYDDRTVVTVAHAIYGSRDFAVRDASGAWHNAVVWHLDLERDLATLHIEELRAAPIPVAVVGPGTGIELLDGAASGAVEGTVVRPVNIKTALVGDLAHSSVRRGYELDLEIAGGDSGAAIVDGSGRLVAVVFARSTGRSGISWATSVDEIEHVTHGRGVPTWDCAPDPGTELVLDPRPASTEARLAP